MTAFLEEIMARPVSRKRKTKMAFVFDPEVAEMLVSLVQDNCLNQSIFVQNAVVRAIRSYRPPVEFVAEGREKAKRSKVGGIDLKLDREDGWPLAAADNMSKGDWKILYGIGERQARSILDENRVACQRLPTSDAEWEEICKVMGPRRKPAANNDWGERE